MIDLTTLSKSYPYLSLARQLGIPYADVLLVSDFYTPSYMLVPGQLGPVLKRVWEHRHAICQVTCAVINGEIGHGD
jgi:hypothetical protein